LSIIPQCDKKKTGGECVARKQPDGGDVGAESLASLVKRVVRQRALKLRDVERRSGGRITNSYISKIISGNIRSLTVEKLLALARGLDVDPHVLFTAAASRPPVSDGEGNGNPVDAGWLVELNQTLLNSPELVSINRKLLGLRPEEHRIVLRYLTLMTAKKREPRPEKRRPRE
jgi:transcriptional regulator with XRE-family HTH domain